MTLFLTFSLIIFLPQQRQIIVNHISNKQFDFNNMGQGGFYFKKEHLGTAQYIQVNNLEKVKFYKDSLVLMDDVEIFYFNGKLKNKIISKIHKKNSVFKFKKSKKIFPANSHVKTKLILSSTSQLIKNIPEALVNSLFRPFPTDTRTKFNIPHFLEVLSIFGFLLLSLFFQKKPTRDEKYIITSLLLFIISLSLIIGWSTTIVGAIVRYRIPVYLAIIILSFILFKPFEKWKNKEITS